MWVYQAIIKGLYMFKTYLILKLLTIYLNLVIYLKMINIHNK